MPTPDASAALSDPMKIRSAVASLYRGILRREPDAAIENFVEAITSGRIDLAEVIERFVTCAEYVKLPKVPMTNRFTNDQSQFGEVESLLRLMVNKDRKCVVVDVGARGKARSNSWDLMNTFGWRGLLVEANPRLADSIKADLEGLDATLVSCAVSNYDGEATFHFGINDDVSSLNQQNAASWGATQGTTKVSVRRLPGLLEEHKVPKDFDLFSVDIEGEDIVVLNDLIDAGYWPGFVIIEASFDYTIERLDQLPFSQAVQTHYEIVDRTRANLILRYRP